MQSRCSASRTSTRSAAATGGAPSPVQVSPRQLQEWAGNTPLDTGFTDASNYTGLILPRDGSSLWPH